MVEQSKCDCLDCVKETQFSRYIKRQDFAYPENHNNLDGKTSDFIGGTLVALKDTSIYGNPNGMFLRLIPAGKEVGKIYSWIERPDGNGGTDIWWQLDKGGFVKHEKGRFDEQALTFSLRDQQATKDAAIDKAVKEHLKTNTNPLYSFMPDLGSSVKWVLIAVIAMIIISVVMRFIPKS